MGKVKKHEENNKKKHKIQSVLKARNIKDIDKKDTRSSKILPTTIEDINLNLLKSAKKNKEDKQKKTKTSKNKTVVSSPEENEFAQFAITDEEESPRKKATLTPKVSKALKIKKTSKKVQADSAFIPKTKADGINLSLDENTVRSGIKALFNIVQANKKDNRLFDDEAPIFLQFSTIKIGRTPSRTLRIPLKHSLLKESGDVCLIIPDAKGKNPKEFERTIEQCEDLLRKNDINNVKTIMTYYQLRTDYSEFELKRKLVELYDIFLVDGKLTGYVSKKLGKIFRRKRKLPIPIRLDVPNIKDNIKHALLKTSTNIHPAGDNFIIQVAHSDMTEDEVYENILEVCANLLTELPGGWDNLRALNIKTDKSTSIPIYYTLKSPALVSVPVVKAKRPKAFKPVMGELSTLDDKIVTVLPSGEVIVGEKDGGEDLSEDEENIESPTKKPKQNEADEDTSENEEGKIVSPIKKRKQNKTHEDISEDEVEKESPKILKAKLKKKRS